VDLDGLEIYTRSFNTAARSSSKATLHLTSARGRLPRIHLPPGEVVGASSSARISDRFGRRKISSSHASTTCSPAASAVCPVQPCGSMLRSASKIIAAPLGGEYTASTPRRASSFRPTTAAAPTSDQRHSGWAMIGAAPDLPAQATPNLLFTTCELADLSCSLHHVALIVPLAVIYLRYDAPESPRWLTDRGPRGGGGARSSVGQTRERRLPRREATWPVPRTAGRWEVTGPRHRSYFRSRRPCSRRLPVAGSFLSCWLLRDVTPCVPLQTHLLSFHVVAGASLHFYHSPSDQLG